MFAAFFVASVCVHDVSASADTADGSPIGSLDVAALVPDSEPRNYARLSLRVAGWAIDPDTTASTKVHIYVNDTLIAVIDAASTRADVAAAFPSHGALHGYDVILTPNGFPFWRLLPGPNEVCTYGIDTGGQANALLGCQTVMAGQPPFGSVDVVTALPDAPLRVAGWVVDPDTSASTGVHIYVDGVYAAGVPATAERSDVGAAYPTYGPSHGFDASLTGVTVASGTRSVCVYGLDTGNLTASGSVQTVHSLIGCRSISIGGSPFGSLDAATSQQDGSTRVAGWAIDPDTAAAISVHVYVDGVLTAAVTASSSRMDVGAAYPLYGSSHGYDTTITGLSAGSHVVCSYGIDSGGDGNALLGCRTIDN